MTTWGSATVNSLWLAGAGPVTQAGSDPLFGARVVWHGRIVDCDPADTVSTQFYASGFSIFGLGRRAGARLLRTVPAAPRRRAEDLLARRGAFAIVVTRPLPVLGDTVAILAGASSMTWRRGAIAATAGSLPEAAAYSLAGALAASTADAAVVWGAFVLVAGAFWLIAGRAERAGQPAAQTQ